MLIQTEGAKAFFRGGGAKNSNIQEYGLKYFLKFLRMEGEGLKLR